MPVGVVSFLAHHEVYTSPELGWEKLRNGALLTAAETAGFKVIITADQNIQYQQNLSALSIAIVVLGSNIWPVVRTFAAVLIERVNAAQPGTCEFIEMPVPAKPRRNDS